MKQEALEETAGINKKTETKLKTYLYLAALKRKHQLDSFFVVVVVERRKCCDFDLPLSLKQLSPKSKKSKARQHAFVLQRFIVSSELLKDVRVNSYHHLGHKCKLIFSVLGCLLTVEAFLVSLHNFKYQLKILSFRPPTDEDK